MKQCTHHIIFDVDGTLVRSFQFDERCFLNAVVQATGIAISNDWNAYPDVTDRGILQTVIEIHSLDYEIAELEGKVKPIFIKNIESHLARYCAEEIAGARQFLENLRERKGYTLSLATGGWRETAVMKLKSAGFDLTGINITSSNDHYSRVKILQLAMTKVNPANVSKTVYFGDGEWDKRSCAELGVAFIGIGDKVEHYPRFNDFRTPEKIFEYLNSIN